MSTARSFVSMLVAALMALCLTISASAAALASDPRAVANQTVLTNVTFGKSIGPFNSSGVSNQNLASTTSGVTAAIGKPGGIFICTDVAWQGLCGYAVQPLNECIVFASPWLDAVSSFGPDPGATCFAFSSNNCDPTNPQWSFSFPGDSSGGLKTTNPWNDKITNFACT
ncbi:hypothetical protein B0H10DRAFT_1993417 [Mycena sp. CBHHK59/15]|nr:hypothetical protein B0H10DRAFT_1993417 [Mycena sp. CBHHK59/15]